MTREKRAQELDELLKSEQGLDKIMQIYRRACPKTGPAEIGLSHGLMISQILDVEFPSVSVDAK